MGQNKFLQKDEDIALLVQRGDIHIFGILIERYEQKIMRYAKKFLSDDEDIKDIVQDVFLKTYKNIKSFDIKRKFSTWLYRIAHNEFVNALKKKKKSLLTFFDLDTFLPHQFVKNSIEQDLDKKDIRQLINNCLNDLELKYKEPLILYYFEEMNYREISEVMRIPVSTVGVRIKRAKEKMKIIYQKSKYNL